MRGSAKTARSQPPPLFLSAVRPELVEGLPATWMRVPIADVATVNPRGTNADTGGDSLVHFVPMAAVIEEFGGIDVSRLRPFREVQKGYTPFVADDVLFAKITPCMENGKAALVPQLSNRIAYGSTEFHVLRGEIGINPKWLAYYVSQAEFRRLARQNMTGSAGQMRVPTFWLSATGIPLAPAPEQTRIVEKLEELLSDLDAGVAELKAAQKKLAQYRQALLKAAVEGSLTAIWRETQPAPSPQPLPHRGGGARTMPSRTRKGSANSAPLSPGGRGAGGEGDGGHAATLQTHQSSETGAQLLARILTERRKRWEAKQLAKFAELGKAPPKDWQSKYPEPVAPDTTDLPALPEGWVWASIEQVASDERYSLSIGPFGSNLKVEDYRDEGVPLVFVRNIRSGKYGGLNAKYVTVEKAAELFAHSINAGDVIITKMGEPPGDADVYPNDQPPAVITADCIKVRCWSGLMHAQFLKVVNNSYVGQKQIQPMTQGVAQKKVSLGRFTNLAVPVPPWDEQNTIIALLDTAGQDIAVLAEAVDHALKQSTAQRKNILKAAFSGQLVPQDPNDEPASVLLARIRVERANQAAAPRSRKSSPALKESI